MGSTKFHLVFLVFTGFYRVLLFFLDYTRFYWVLLGFTGFYWITFDKGEDGSFDRVEWGGGRQRLARSAP